MNAYSSFFKKYATFSGRARRQEYWMAYLFNMIAIVLLVAVDTALLGLTEQGAGILSGIYMIAIIIPSLAVTVRRLHDTDRSGWWILISLVPLVGILLLVFMCMEGTRGENRFGADPKADSALPAAA
jgi:uncharacterized membrane protein YhaH (DUF805 family)